MSSESAKSLKSSPSIETKPSEFEAFSGGHQVEFTQPQDISVPSNDFRIAKTYHDAIVENPGLKELLEEEVENRVEAKLKEDNEKELAKIREEAKKQGFDSGLNEAKEQLKAFKVKFGKVCESIIQEKSKILKDHEGAWCHGLASLMKKTLQSHRTEFVDEVKKWISENVDAFATQGSIAIQMSPEQYKAYEPEFSQIQDEQWKFLSNESLAPGEMRFVTSAGEIFFSESKAHSRLDQIVSKYFSLEDE